MGTEKGRYLPYYGQHLTNMHYYDAFLAIYLLIIKHILNDLNWQN